MRKRAWLAGAALMLSLGMGLQAGAQDLADSWANEAKGLLGLFMTDPQQPAVEEVPSDSQEAWNQDNTVGIEPVTEPGELPEVEDTTPVNDDSSLETVQPSAETGADYRSIFMAYLDQEGVIYDTVSETNSVKISFTCDNTDITVFVQFDKEGEDNVRFVSYSYGHFGEEKLQAGIELCNELNKEYRWVKFYIDGDYDLTCDCDAYVTAETAGEISLRMVRRLVSIMDEAYPRVMQARWGA